LRTNTIQDVNRMSGQDKSWTIKLGLGAESWEATGRSPHQPVEILVTDRTGSRFVVKAFQDFITEAETLIDLCMWSELPCAWRKIRKVVLDLFSTLGQIPTTAEIEAALNPVAVLAPQQLTLLLGAPSPNPQPFAGAATMQVQPDGTYQVFDAAGASVGTANQAEAQRLARSHQVTIRGI
jgi:hypothetical protein